MSKNGFMKLKPVISRWKNKRSLLAIEFRQAILQLCDIVSKVWIYIVAGIAIGAAVHGYVPENFMASIMGKSVWWSVPLAVLNRRSSLFQCGGHYPDSSGALGKGRGAGHGTGLYDVGNRAIASRNDHIKKSDQAAADHYFYQRSCHRHYDCGISLQLDLLKSIYEKESSVSLHC